MGTLWLGKLSHVTKLRHIKNAFEKTFSLNNCNNFGTHGSEIYRHNKENYWLSIARIEYLVNVNPSSNSCSTNFSRISILRNFQVIPSPTHYWHIPISQIGRSESEEHKREEHHLLFQGYKTCCLRWIQFHSISAFELVRAPPNLLSEKYLAARSLLSC